jgi:predicted DNA-binding transcriptional regulator YafY
VRISYLRADGARVERCVSPLGLVAKGLIWYLVAAGDDARPRTYRVSRVAAATISDTPSRVPDGFDLAGFWEASKARLVAGVPRFRVQFRAAASVVPELERAGRWSHLVSVGEPDAHGRVEVAMDFELENDACALALSFGSKLELVSPASLRTRVAGELAAAARQYGAAGA